jgi:hypothetical protein
MSNLISGRGKGQRFGRVDEGDITRPRKFLDFENNRTQTSTRIRENTILSRIPM